MWDHNLLEITMRAFLRAMMVLIVCLFVVFLTLTASAEADASSKDCSQPLVLKLTPSDTGGTKYDISGKVYAGYPLDDIRRLLSACSVSRVLYVIIDSHVPIGQISSAVASKLQREHVRYFITYPPGDKLVIEIKITDYLSKLPWAAISLTSQPPGAFVNYNATHDAEGGDHRTCMSQMMGAVEGNFAQYGNHSRCGDTESVSFAAPAGMGVGSTIQITVGILGINQKPAMVAPIRALDLQGHRQLR
jgi:hypothetical protein